MLNLQKSSDIRRLDYTFSKDFHQIECIGTNGRIVIGEMTESGNHCEYLLTGFNVN